jgi:membrane-bound lytic murein transglycosylase D
MTVDTLADALNVREGALRELNPALTDIVWSGDKYVPLGFELRVPRATAAVAEDLFAAIEPSALFAAQRADREHRVRRGDSLSKIAAEYRVSLAARMRVNGLTGRDVIRVGQTIRLPVDGGDAPTVAVAAALPPEPVPAPAPVATGAEGTYVVRRGDSIDRIATRLGVDPDALIASNGIRNRNLIQVGQRLVVPGASGDPSAALASLAAVPAPVRSSEPTPAAAAEPTVAAETPLADAELTAALAPAVLQNGNPAPAEDAAGEGTPDINALASEQDALAADPTDYSVTAANEITVQPLETLGHYADWLGIPTQRLRDLNRLEFREAVTLGRRLKLEFAGVDAAAFEQRRRAYHQQIQSDFFATFQIEEVDSHVIKPGESLWVLAARTYKVPVWLLRQYNPDVDLDRVQPGTVVKFPRLKAIAAQTVAAAPQVLADNAR